MIVATGAAQREPLHGLAEHVGSVEVGKLADLVLWKPAFFGVKPELVVKGGLIAWAAMGDPNASIPTPQPVLYRPMYGALGRARPQDRMRRDPWRQPFHGAGPVGRG